jgi:hypothetical protein
MMTDWDAILTEADQLAGRLIRQNVDLAEAARLLDYFVYKDCDSAAVSKYLAQMSQSPPPRSRRSQMHFRNLRQIWDGWRTQLKGEDKARTWGWAVREARVRKQR